MGPSSSSWPSWWTRSALQLEKDSNDEALASLLCEDFQFTTSKNSKKWPCTKHTRQNRSRTEKQIPEKSKTLAKQQISWWWPMYDCLLLCGPIILWVVGCNTREMLLWLWIHSTSRHNAAKKLPKCDRISTVNSRVLWKPTRKIETSSELLRCTVGKDTFAPLISSHNFCTRPICKHQLK